MRTILGLAAVALLAASGADAQPAPPGSYRSQCSNIRMEGQFLSADCRGARGGGHSSINVQSCASDIYVDETGALACRGPGAAGGPGYAPGRPAYAPGIAPDRGYRPPAGYGREQAVVFTGRDWRGRSMRIDGPISNLARFGLNDRVRSIQLGRRSGPWEICTDANFRGRCRTVGSSIGDVRQFGLAGVSSLRPAH
jgi:hypothetical protein